MPSKKRFRATPTTSQRYPSLHGRRRFLLLVGGSLATALSMGARGGCMPVPPAPEDLRVPDAGRPDARRLDSCGSEAGHDS